MSDRVQGALKKRREQEDNSKKYSSSKVQGALNAYRNQVTKELPSIIEDINTRYNTLVDNFNSTSVGFGTDAIENEKTLRGDANREIMSLTAGIEKYRAYLGDEQTDAFLKNLSGLSSAYRNRKAAAEVQSQFKDKAELDAATENYYYNKRYTDRYSGMTQGERKAKLEELWAARGTGDREYNWLNDYIMLNEDVDEAELDQLSRYLDSYNHNINLISGDKYTPDEAKKLLEDEGWGNYDELARKVQFYNDSKAYQSEHYYATLPQNEDFAENSSVDASVSDPEYKYINGINGTSFPERVYNLVSELYDENEIAIYNYLYNTKGKEEADKYIEYIAGTVRDRYAEKIASGYYDSSNWEKLGFIGKTAIDQVPRKLYGIFDEEIARTQSAESLASQKVRDTMSGGWGVAADAVQTVAEQVPSTGIAIGLSFINPTLGAYVGMGTMSAVAGGGAYAEALQSGKSRDEAIKMGILTAASEIVTEKALGGVTAFGESLVGKHLDDVVKGINGGLARAGAKLGLSAASEGMEEAVQSVLEQTIIPNLAYGEQNGWGDVEWGEVAYSALLGAISGGVIEGATNIAPNAIAENVKYANEGKKITSVKGGTDALNKASEAYLNNIDRSALTNESGRVEVSNLQKTYDSLVNGKKTPSNRKVGKLATRLEQARVATNKSDIESRLRSSGIENDNLVGVASSAIYKAMSGEELSGFEAALIVGYDAVNNVYQAVKDSEANASYREYTTKLTEAAGKAETISASADKGTTEMPVQGEYEAPENVPVEVKSTKAEATFGEFVTKDDGTLAVKTDDGTEVDVKDVSFNGSDVGIIYETVASIDGITSVEANALASGYRGDVSPSEYAMGIKEAYAYGRYGMPQSQLANSADAYRLSETARNNAYEMGKMAEAASVKAKQEKIDKKAESTKGATKAKAGKVIVEDASIAVDSKTGKIDKSNLNKAQKAGVVTAEFLSEVSSLNVHIFKSHNVDGKLVATINGKVVERAPNGVYFKGTNDIWVDINAGNHGEGTMLWTMAHEISHFIRDKAPTKWKAMADYIMEEYGKNDVDIPALLEKKKESVRKTNESLSESQVSEKAYEELVSDALSEMLDDGSVVDAIAKIKEQDAGLWQTIKGAVANLIQKLKKYLDAYRGRAADTTEAQILRSIEGAYEKLRQMYAEAFAEASDVGGDIAQFDADSESVAPMLSERTWSESEYVTERDSAARSIADALGVDVKTAYQYIDDVNSIAKLIADNRIRLDYKASPFGSAFVSNSEYGGSFDFTTLCKKRRLFTGTFSEIQKRLKNTALTPDDILKIRNMLIEKGLEATCGLCYVEGSRANMGKFAKEFIRLYKRDNPDAWIPNMADVNTPDGVESMKINHPEAYEQYEYFWNHYGKLKDSDPALFASQQKPKLYEARKEYKGEILEKFGDDSAVEKKNRNGGIRMQSFSDFEIVHLIDTMQIIMDMSRVGLAGQAYTKVPEFAKAFGDTGLKINLSLIAKGIDENGQLIFDDREGMPHEVAFDLRSEHSKNVGTIIVTFTDEQLLAAMADPRIDFIIPFHRSQWKKGQYGAMGLPKGTKDYTYMQNEKLIKQTYHEYHGRQVKDKATNYMPNEYWDFSKSGKENAEAYLKMCAENNKRPKFYKLLDYDGKGTYSLKKDGSTDGYWKLLIDFKMYDNEGVGSPQTPVAPTFSMNEATQMLEDYKGGHSTYPVANEVVDEFVEQYGTEPEMMFSERDFSYDELTAKDDLRGVVVEKTEHPKITNGLIDASWVVGKVKRQCKTLETNGGTVYFVSIPDIGENVEIVGDGIKHGFARANDIRNGKSLPKAIINARAMLALPEILSNSIEVNRSRRGNNMDVPYTHVMIGTVALEDNNGNLEYYAVRSMVQERKNLNPVLIESDILGKLTSVNVKKISLPTAQVATNSVAPADGEAYTYSIADLLNDVKNNFDDTFSEDVYNHFGMKRTENEHFSKHLLFSERNTDTDIDLSPRAVLADALESVAQNEDEVRNLREYKAELEKIEKIEEELSRQRAEIKEMSFAKGTRDQAYKDKLSKLRLEAQKNQNRIDNLDKKLLRLEAAKPLKDLLERERAKVRKRDLEKYRTLMKESHDKQIESMDKRSARGKVQKLILETTEWLNHPKKTDVKCPDFLKAPYLDFLESLVFPEGDTPTDIASKSLRSGKDMTKQDLKFVNALNSLANSIEAIQKTQDATSEDNPNVPDEAIQGYLDLPQSFVNELKEMARSIDAAMKIGDFNLVDMSSADFKAIAKKIRTLNHSIRELSTLYSNGRFAKIEELGAESIDYFESLGHKGTKIVGEDFLNWDNALPYYAFKKFGDAGLAVFKELQDAQGTLANHAKSIFDFKEKTWTDKEAKAWADEVHSIEISSGTIELAATDIMTIYCLSKREQAQGHLYGDGIKLPGKRRGLKETIETGTKLTENDVQNIIGTLSKRQIEVADAIQRFMSTVCAEWGNEISMKRFLTREFTEPNYFPIETTDDGRPVKDQAVQQADLYRLLNISATKETIKNARNAIVIHNIFEVFAGHTSDMAKLNAFGLPLLDFMKWINYNQLTDDGKVSLRAKMRDAFGDGAKKYALNLIKDVNGRYTDNADHPLFMHFMRTTKAANVGGSLRVALLQFTAYPRAAMVLDKRSLALALAQSPKKLSSAIGKMQKYSGIALWKSFGFYDTNIARSVEAQIAGKKSVREAIIELGFKLPEIADNLTWGSLWNACEYEIARANKHMSTKSEEFYKAVAEKFDEVVYATQVVDSVLTKSQLMRSKSGVTQTFTAYMSEPTVAANILMDAAWEVKSAKRRGVSTKAAWKHFRKAASVYGVCAVVQALAGALADAYRDDDEEKTFGEKFLAQLHENGVQEVNPFNKIPFLSDLSELISSKFGIGYFSTDSMTHTWLANGAKAFDAWKALTDEDSDKTLYNAIYETARFASSVTGVSASNAMREVVDMWNHIAGAIDDDLKIRKTDRTSTQNFNRLYNAIVSGDDAKVTKIMGELEKAEFDEGQITNGLVKALYTNDPEIITTASAYIGGDLDAFTVMVDNLVGMGFDEDTAAKAIRSIVSKVKSAAQSKADGDTEAYEKKVDELVDLGYDKEQLMSDIDTIEITPGGEGKEVSIYVKDDYKLAYGTANEDMMAEIEEDVRETMLANGKTDEDVDKKILSWKKECIKEKHLDGAMSEASATKSLMEADAKLSENDAYWLLKKWRISSQHADEEDYSYSKYNEWYDAIMAGENLKQIINEHITHTDYKDKETKSEHEKRVKSALASSVTSHFKPLFVAATTKSERANIKARCLWAYEALGYNRSDKSKDIDAWLKD